MVQTRAAAKRIESGQPVQPSSTKKRTEPAKRPRRGKPGELCRLNLDVLFLISAYIHPIDLLNLARTCKSLRELLMSKASEFVWKTARRQVDGLPQCPADLTEPEYANLVFYARCHGCGKYAKKILWSIRRRYCTECKPKRLFPLAKCDSVITMNYPLRMETLQIADETSTWVDKEQMESFMDEYHCSSDKDQFLNERKAQYNAISRHVRECMNWERILSMDRRGALYTRRIEREHSIFERLKQHGFQPEISYYGSCGIRRSNNSLFRTSKPLTDKEWALVWPEWVITLNDLRFKRLDNLIYRPRRDMLANEYSDYVARTPPETPHFDFLPHAWDLARIAPFENIIKGPEEARMYDRPFKSAFAQLPDFVDEWREKLDSELAEMVKIPDHLSARNPSKGKSRLMTANDATGMRSSNLATRKLKLASAVFVTDVVSRYPEVLHTMHPPKHAAPSNDDTLSIGDQFRIRFLEDAPYIVHACGLDPNVATDEDMDNLVEAPLLRCLVCEDRPLVRSWREALLHADRDIHDLSSQTARWEAISGHHKDGLAGEAEAVRRVLQYSRCLLCRPHVGDAKLHHTTTLHLELQHDIKLPDDEPGVHYAFVGISGSER